MIANSIFFCACIVFLSGAGFASNQTRALKQVHLSNGIQALLISDPSLTESTASLSVEAGSWDDPEDHLGMAHFVEHLLFLGTKAYPGETDYPRYILERGGRYNAYTQWDRTLYGFSISNDSFPKALDLFSHLFIDPLFTVSAIEREVHALHHEFEDSIEDASLRVWEVLRENGNQNHPNVRFSYGNLESLFQIKQTDVAAWFKQHYRPEQMKLVLMSPEPLDSLATSASYYFSKIQMGSKKEKAKLTSTAITSSEQRGTLTYLKPALKNRSLVLIWEVENSGTIHHLERALELECAQIRDEESLSLGSHVEFWKISKERGLLMITTALTQKGALQYEKVISRCFQALNGLKLKGIPKEIDCSPFFETDLDCAMNAASQLLDGKMQKFSQSSIENLNPFECIYFLIVPPEEVGVKLSHIEKWTGAAYEMQKLSEEKLHQWNLEVPLQLNRLQEEKDAAKKDFEEDLDPVLILENEKASVSWIKSPSTLGFLDAAFRIITPCSSRSAAKQGALNEIFVQRMNELLNQEKEIFKSLDIDGCSLSLLLRAREEEANNSFQYIFSILKNANTSRAQFEKTRKGLIDSWSGCPPLLKYAEEVLDSILTPGATTQEEIYDALLCLEFEEYQLFERSYFAEVFVEAAFLGGESHEELIDLWESMSMVLDAKPYKPKICSPLSFPEDVVIRKTHRKGNALLLCVEVGEPSSELKAIHQIITVFLHSEFFSELRIKQQTAYKLHTWKGVIGGKLCHHLAIQSSTQGPEELLYRVESFLNDFSDQSWELLSFERFETIRGSLKATHVTYEQVLNEIHRVFSKEGRKRLAVLIEGDN